MSIESNLADEKGEGDTFFGKLLKPGNDLLGYILIITSFVIWAEGNNLRSLNIIAVIIVIFWLFVNLLTKTRLFIKKEKDPSNPSRKRKLKILSYENLFFALCKDSGSCLCTFLRNYFSVRISSVN